MLSVDGHPSSSRRGGGSKGWLTRLLMITSERNERSLCGALHDPNEINNNNKKTDIAITFFHYKTVLLSIYH